MNEREYNSELNRRQKEKGAEIRKAQERQELSEQEPVKIHFSTLKRDDYVLLSTIFIVFLLNFLILGWDFLSGFIVALVMAGGPVFIARGRPSRVLLYLMAGLGIFALLISIFN